MPVLFNCDRRRALWMIVIMLLIQGGGAAMAAFAMRDLFNALHGQGPLPLRSMAALALSGGIIATARVAARTKGEMLGQSFALDTRVTVFDHGAAMTNSDVSKRRAGYVSLRFVGDMTALRNWPGLGVPRMLSAVIMIPTTFAVLGALHLPLLWALMPLYLVGLALMLMLGRRLPDMHRRLRSRRAAIAADMAERMPLAPQLGAIGRRHAESARIVSRSDRMIVAARARRRLVEILKSVPDILAGIGAVLVIWVGTRSGAETATIAGGLAALGIALSPMRDLATVWNHKSAFRIAYAKCKALLDRPPRPTTGNGRTLPLGPVGVRVKDLCFGQVQGLNCDVPAGAHVQLTGSNGTGKSGLLRLFTGLDVATHGQVRLAGKRIETLSQGSLRRSVGLVSSDPLILKGSMRRALTLGVHPRPDDCAILRMAERFGLMHLIQTRGGLDSQLGEGGRDLSTGEKIRIAALRVALRNPGLILLDAETSQLDRAGLAILRDWLKSSDATVISVDPGRQIGLEFKDVLPLFGLHMRAV